MERSSDIASAGQTFSHGFEQSGGQSSGSNSREQTMKSSKLTGWQILVLKAGNQ
jgi:hypothetical protein